MNFRLIILSFILIILGIFVGLSARLGGAHQINLLIGNFIQAVQPVWLINLNRIISFFENILIISAIIVSGFFILKKKRKEAILFLIVGLSWFLVKILKTLFGDPCPTPEEIKVIYGFPGIASIITEIVPSSGKIISPSVCYPSGHVFNFVVIGSMLFYLRKQITGNKRLQNIISLIVVGLIVLVGQSRISLGAHWFTDVIGGYLFGFAWVLFLIAIYNKFKKSVG